MHVYIFHKLQCFNRGAFFFWHATFEIKRLRSRPENSYISDGCLTTKELSSNWNLLDVWSTQVGWILFTKKNVPKGRYYISYMDAILGGAWKGAKERTKHPFIKKSQGATLTIRSAQLSIRYGYAQIFVPCQTAKPVDTVWLLVFFTFFNSFKSQMQRWIIEHGASFGGLWLWQMIESK